MSLKQQSNSIVMTKFGEKNKRKEPHKVDIKSILKCINILNWIPVKQYYVLYYNRYSIEMHIQSV